MDNKKFRKEIHEFIDSAYDELNSYKRDIYEIIREFQRVCKENNITYYVAFGSLLSIVRDNMLVLPWDKDADFLLPFSARDRLHQALKKDLPEDFFFMSHELNPNYRLLMLRIGKKGYALDTFHLDVFYMIGAPDIVAEQTKMKEDIRKLIRRNEIKTHFCNERILTKENGRLHLNLSNLKYKFISYFYDIDNEYHELCNRYPFDSSNYYITIGNGAEVFPKTLFEPKRLITVDGCECYVPGDSEKFLELRYGDFRSLFPVANRFDEFYNGYKDVLFSVKNQNLSSDRKFII